VTILSTEALGLDEIEFAVMAVTVGLCGMLYYRFKRSGWL
jgi:hypothetical protein